ARRHVWLVELGVASLTLLSGVLAYLLAMALVDHWLWPLSTFARWVALAVLLVAAGAYSWRYLVPLLVRSINPLYAARTIERSDASLKNSLINFLFFRDRPDAVPAAVLDALKRTAADDLSKVAVEASVDRTRLIRVLYVLTAAVAICALYKVASPKDPFQSASRVLLPWIPQSAPTRVTITDIEPGSTTGLYDEQVMVSARIRGASDDDPIRVVYSTADQQEVNRAVAMSLDSSGLRYEAPLPGGSHGLRQDLIYHIEAGVAVSPTFELRLVARPMIFVERLEYEFPEYMQRPRQVVERQGDIEALEGTRVRLIAKANKPLRLANIEWNPP